MKGPPEDAFGGPVTDVDQPLSMTVVGSAKIQATPEFGSLVAAVALSEFGV
jgi:hypothetical protein